MAETIAELRSLSDEEIIRKRRSSAPSLPQSIIHHPSSTLLHVR
jgi:hypothetical protein